MLEPAITFFVVGAARSGTTSLHRYLSQHPDVFLPDGKPRFLPFLDIGDAWTGPGDAELRRNSTPDASSYAALYARRATEHAVGDVSTAYLYHPSTPALIRKQYPTARIIAVLRNPADRAFSAYQIMRRRGLEPISDFEQALAAEPQRIEAGWSFAWHYQTMGFYHEQIRRYLNAFEAERVFVLTYDEFTSEPTVAVQNCYRFIGVDDTFVPDTQRIYNRSGTSSIPLIDQAVLRPTMLRRAVRAIVPRAIRHALARNQHFGEMLDRRLESQTMAPETRNRLVDLYREDIGQLALLTGLDLGSWLQ